MTFGRIFNVLKVSINYTCSFMWKCDYMMRCAWLKLVVMVWYEKLVVIKEVIRIIKADHLVWSSCLR